LQGASPEMSEFPPPPHRIDTRQPISKKLSRVTAVPNLLQIRPRELLGKCVKYNENFIYVAQLQPAQQQHGGLYVLLLFLFYFFGYFYRFLSDQLSQTLPDRSSPNFTAGRTVAVIDQCEITF